MPHVRQSCKAKHPEEVLEASSGWMDRVGVLIMELYENMTLGCERSLYPATSGFDFECTHVVEPERIQKPVALMAIAYCWCVATGKWLNSIKEIKIKKYGGKEIGLFRHKLNELGEVLLNISDRFDAFGQLAERFLDSVIPVRKCLNKVDLRCSCFLYCT